MASSSFTSLSDCCWVRILRAMKAKIRAAGMESFMRVQMRWDNSNRRERNDQMRSCSKLSSPFLLSPWVSTKLATDRALYRDMRPPNIRAVDMCARGQFSHNKGKAEVLWWTDKQARVTYPCRPTCHTPPSVHVVWCRRPRPLIPSLLAQFETDNTANQMINLPPINHLCNLKHQCYTVLQRNVPIFTNYFLLTGIEVDA